MAGYFVRRAGPPRGRARYALLTIPFVAAIALLAAMLVSGSSPTHAATSTATIDFESGLSAGDTPSALSIGTGISGGPVAGSVAVAGSANSAMIFDSNCSGAGCSGGDSDLGVGSGNVLIVS